MSFENSTNIAGVICHSEGKDTPLLTFVRHDYSTPQEYYLQLDSFKEAHVVIPFQVGPVDPVEGPNGISMESLLEVCLHRLESFQRGAVPSDHNAVAIDGIKAALHSLNTRTLDRLTRGVIATSNK